MRKMVFPFTALLLVFALFVPSASFASSKHDSSNSVKAQAGSKSGHYGEDQEVQKKVKNLLQQMTLEEKISMVHGIDKSGYIGYVPAIDRLGIPSIKLTDGPGGVRAEGTTAFPAPIALSSAWDPDLAHRYGAAVGEETLAKGQNVILGPTVNILRVPQWGRSFESFSEDPYLTTQMGTSWIKGAQDQGVIATVKHYVTNTQEYNRGSVNSEVGERALHEIYFPAFKAAVQQAHVGSVMSAYNKVNGTYSSENKQLLTDTLKKDWGFDGFVVSDWGGTHSTVQAANGGLDMQMPTGSYFGEPLLEAVKNGKVSEDRLDDMVGRILTAMFNAGLFEKNRPEGSLNHTDFARKVAEQGTVLLKNNRKLLPLNKKQLNSIAVIGAYAKNTKVTGGGSARITPDYDVSPLEGIKKAVGSDVDVRYAKGYDINPSLPVIDSSLFTPAGGEEGQHGLKAEYFNNMDLKGDPVLTRVDQQVDFNWGYRSPAPQVNSNGFSVRWTGQLTAPVSGKYQFGLTSDDGMRMYINGKPVVDSWSDHSVRIKVGSIHLEAGKRYDIKIEYYDNDADAIAQLGWIKPGETDDSSIFTPAEGKEGQHGLKAEYFNNKDLKGDPVLTRVDQQVDFNWGKGSPAPEINGDNFSVRWTGQLTIPDTGTYNFGLTSDDGMRLYIDGKLIVDNWGNHAERTKIGSVKLEAGKRYDVKIEYYDNGSDAVAQLFWLKPGDAGTPVKEAADIAGKSDVAVVVVADNRSEGEDQDSLELPYDQDETIDAVAKANPNTIVVLNTGGPVLMNEWLDDVPAVLEEWYGGQESGSALADVLFGKVNPSGKLPISFLKHPKDASTADTYPGDGKVAEFTDGIYVGYRHLDEDHIEPLFPFGYGLSYTTFAYDHLKITPKGPKAHADRKVSFDVTNTGSQAGSEVAQLYMGLPETNAKEPPKQLKRFKKVFLKPGETKHITFQLDDQALSYWDTDAHQWVTQNGTYHVMVGSSSRDIHLQDSFNLDGQIGPRFTTVQAPGIIVPGETMTVTTKFTNGGGVPAHQVKSHLQVPSGWDVKAASASSFQTVQAGKSVETKWNVSIPTDASPGSIELKGETTFHGKGGHSSTTGTANSTVAYSSFDSAFNNIAISSDDNPSEANFDGTGVSYSAQALAKVGLTPGAKVTHDGFDFTWPNVPSGQPDNIVAGGQAIKISGSGDMLGFLGSAAIDDASGEGEILYTDGTAQSFTLTFTNWYHDKPVPGNDLIATTSSWNYTSDQKDHKVSVYFSAVPLDRNKTVKAVKLPNVSQGVGKGVTQMHVFALAIKYSPSQNIAEMIKRVDRFEKEGAFGNHEAAHAMHIHLQTVKYYEEKGATDKVIKHLKSFEVLLDHQKNNELISDEAYQALKGDTEYLIKKYQQD